MAKVVPDSRTDMIAWFAQRAPIWAANGAKIGLTPEQITALAGFVNTAQTTEAAAFAARAASKDATVVYHNEAEVLRDFGAGLVKTIKAYADATDNPNVYSDASIPPPAPPAPLGPPATPTDVTASINNEGHVELNWSGSRAGGTSFLVERTVTPVGGSTGAWTLLASVEERDFIDTAVPQGLASALYRIKAQRAGGTSVASEPGQVLFGTASAGSGQTASNLNLAA